MRKQKELVAMNNVTGRRVRVTKTYAGMLSHNFSFANAYYAKEMFDGDPEYEDVIYLAGEEETGKSYKICCLNKPVVVDGRYITVTADNDTTYTIELLGVSIEAEQDMAEKVFDREYEAVDCSNKRDFEMNYKVFEL